MPLGSTRDPLVAAAGEIVPQAEDWGIATFINRNAPEAFLAEFARTLDRFSYASAGRRYSAVSRAVRVQVLSQIEQRQNDRFTQFRDLVYEGCYAHPRHGGNRRAQSWATLQFP
jgi:hypothetical protein